MSRISYSEVVAAAPDAVFARVIDLAGLPSWNDAIREVVELPDTLDIGSVWKVRVHALGNTWVSRSTVEELDPAGGRFAYRSQSDDGKSFLCGLGLDRAPGGCGLEGHRVGRRQPPDLPPQVPPHPRAEAGLAQGDAALASGSGRGGAWGRRLVVSRRPGPRRGR